MANIKDWSTTKKILVVLGILILFALLYMGITSYIKDKKEADGKRVQNRIDQVVQDQKVSDSITGDQLTKAIRDNLAKQPVSEIGVKFYQPSNTAANA